jgi:hypothetical protein
MTVVSNFFTLQNKSLIYVYSKKRIQFICTGCITDQKISSTCFKDCHTNTGCITGQKISSTCFKGCHTNTGCITGQRISSTCFKGCHTNLFLHFWTINIHTYTHVCNTMTHKTELVTHKFYYWTQLYNRYDKGQ